MWIIKKDLTSNFSFSSLEYSYSHSNGCADGAIYHTPQGAEGVGYKQMSAPPLDQTLNLSLGATGKISRNRSEYFAFVQETDLSWPCDVQAFHVELLANPVEARQIWFNSATFINVEISQEHIVRNCDSSQDASLSFMPKSSVVFEDFWRPHINCLLNLPSKVVLEKGHIWFNFNDTVFVNYCLSDSFLQSEHQAFRLWIISDNAINTI